MDLSLLPALNATLNGISTLLLLTGIYFIRRKDVERHRLMMLSAFALSIVFLLCYLAHKKFLYDTTDSFNMIFRGEGLWRTVYFLILIPHVILAMFVPVLAGISLFRGLKMQVERHRAIVRWTFPVWLFVSVTGVIVYFMLYQWF